MVSVAKPVAAASFLEPIVNIFKDVDIVQIYSQIHYVVDFFILFFIFFSLGKVAANRMGGYENYKTMIIALTIAMAGGALFFMQSLNLPGDNNHLFGILGNFAYVLLFFTLIGIAYNLWVGNATSGKFEKGFLVVFVAWTALKIWVPQVAIKPLLPDSIQGFYDIVYAFMLCVGIYALLKIGVGLASRLGGRRTTVGGPKGPSWLDRRRERKATKRADEEQRRAQEMQRVAEAEAKLLNEMGNLTAMEIQDNQEIIQDLNRLRQLIARYSGGDKGALPLIGQEINRVTGTSRKFEEDIKKSEEFAKNITKRHWQERNILNQFYTKEKQLTQFIFKVGSKLSNVAQEQKWVDELNKRVHQLSEELNKVHEISKHIDKYISNIKGSEERFIKDLKNSADSLNKRDGQKASNYLNNCIGYKNTQIKEIDVLHNLIEQLKAESKTEFQMEEYLRQITGKLEELLNQQQRQDSDFSPVPEHTAGFNKPQIVEPLTKQKVVPEKVMKRLDESLGKA
ncbi:hypothetical protein COV93_05495 [Candidatus Woesearchaeota archaeon CG11_big_fil_rev_8_21_14_0_20_43_8]|nr:MAG: hypothetical protein COV93_05495 [Candidatus Woesearchaeota archaeon CG11_big_fil_rev_8_21_14_0_20_43_8]PIO04638.1 MAG: hypothetical protein COT47_08145 [Candidatus Woesearchaeota archaeon CG08_land_8_20_14_0_20_43_7]